MLRKRTQTVSMLSWQHLSYKHETLKTSIQIVYSKRYFLKAEVYEETSEKL
jgi:hypothetical protein